MHSRAEFGCFAKRGIVCFRAGRTGTRFKFKSGGENRFGFLSTSELWFNTIVKCGPYICNLESISVSESTCSCKLIAYLQSVLIGGALGLHFAGYAALPFHV
jgi:hypothetical protein